MLAVWTAEKAEREGVMVVTCEGSGMGRVGGSEGEWLKYIARRVG